MILPLSMAGILKEMYDLALERPETACSRLRWASHTQTFYAWAKQIENAHGLFSDDLWHEINKCETISATERGPHQKNVSKMVRILIKENDNG